MKDFNWRPIFLFPTIVILGTVVYAKPASGTISGTVKDSEDRPVAGAVVRLFNPTEEEAVLKTTTDKNGHFLASNLSPGNYKLQALAAGYKPVIIAEANVTPFKNTIFDLKLQKASSLLTSEQEKDSYKYVLRRNRTIFQLDRIEEEVVAKKPFIPQTHGIVNLVSAKAISSQPLATNTTMLNFAIDQLISENLELVVSGQSGLSANSPQRLNIQASLSANDDHKIDVAVGYGQLPVFLSGNASNFSSKNINQYTIQAIDKWRISGPIVIVYGFDYSHFDGAKQPNRLNPRINLDLQLSPNDQIFAAIYSPTGAEIESSTEFETTKVDFKGPVELINLYPQTDIPNNQRYELGYSHTFKDRSRLETTLFWDRVSNHTPLQASNLESSQADQDLTINTISQVANNKGFRVVFSQPITNNISATVGYSFGQGQELEASSNGQPSISVGYFHIFTGKLAAQLATTGTKISAVLRVASPNALLAIDPFEKQLKMLDPNISVYITQAVPMFSFIPGRWEATLDARNLLDLQIGNQHSKAVLSQYWRSVRGGFSVRF